MFITHLSNPKLAGTENGNDRSYLAKSNESAKDIKYSFSARSENKTADLGTADASDKSTRQGKFLLKTGMRAHNRAQ